MIMKNQLYLTAWMLFLSIAGLSKLAAQCSPAMGTTCANAPFFCSLEEIDGYTCSNTSTTPSSCSPICSQGGQAENTNWIGFFTNGGNVSVTLSVGSCSNSQGLEFGIIENCHCSKPIACQSSPCVPPGGSATINANLSKCVQYYLWIDGCNGDVCDFTINTSGGAAPKLDPIGYINNEASKVIKNVCPGCYNFYSVQGMGDLCNVYYVWELDGQLLTEGVFKNGFEYLIKNIGTYELCVTAYIRNPKDPNIICDQQGPQCATIEVTGLPDRNGRPRTLCYEAIGSTGYKWHSQYIKTSGVYREKLRDKKNCCYYDSVVEFTVLEEPAPAIVQYIGCNNEPYIDILGRRQGLCLQNAFIKLPNTTNPDLCDSSIILTTINVDYAPSWSINCIGGQVELVPNIKIAKPCNVGESYEFDYSWYKKNDPTKKVISYDERLAVPAISEDYILQVKVITYFNNETFVCYKTFSETFNEGNLAPECAFKLNGNKVYCFDYLSKYWVDSFLPGNVKAYHWTVNGGNIISNPDSSVVDVVWNLNANDTGRICLTYDTDCGSSCQKCKPVILETSIAGQDFEKRGLSAYLDAKSHPNGIWRLISGPHPVRIDDPTNPKTRISAYNYGYYCFEWTVTDINCVIKDTLCVDLHFYKTTSPEYPDRLFDERAAINPNETDLSSIIFTPNLIQQHGQSFVLLNNLDEASFSYKWYNLYGQLVLQDVQTIESGIQRQHIQSPTQSGMFFLLVELGKTHLVQKICVMD